MKRKILLISAFTLWLGNAAIYANNNYTVVSEKDTTVGDLKRTDIRIQVGENPLNAFSIQRIVKAGKCDHYAARLFVHF